MSPSVKEAEFITLDKAAAIFPSRPHINTIVRWANRGFGGVILKTWRCGRRRVTTIDAIQEFVDRTSGLPPQENRGCKSYRQRMAEARLDALLAK